MTQPLIYVVDDDEAIRRSLSFMLKTSGFAVQSFSGGIPFLKEAAGLEQGCVLLDVRMPDMDGLEVQRELRARGVLLPVIIMTGHGDVGMAVAAMKAGARRHRGGRQPAHWRRRWRPEGPPSRTAFR